MTDYGANMRKRSWLPVSQVGIYVPAIAACVEPSLSFGPGAGGAACPVALQSLGTTEQVGQRAMRRPSPSTNERG